MSGERFVLDGYAARSCPIKTINQFNPTLTPPDIEVGTPPIMHDAAAIEAEVVQRLTGGGASVADLRSRERSAEEREAATLAALASGVDVVIGGRLPRDWEAHRTGRPTLLVRHPAGHGYHPVQIKYHRVLEQRPIEDTPLVYSTLEAPTRYREKEGRGYRWGQRLNAALQVAHYWRLLEATGFAAEHPWAGLIGTERVVVPDETGRPGPPVPVITWLDLAAPVVPPHPRTVPDPGAADPVSALDRYDHEHGERVRLAEAARAATGPDPLMLPVMHRECPYCVWREYCEAQLDADDLSRQISKAPLDVHEVQTLREFGINTVAELAAVDLDALADTYLPRVSHRLGGEARIRLAHRRARLIVDGVALERETAGPIELPRHDLEIDLDIETSSDDHVYLWGFHVDDRTAGVRYYKEVSAFVDLDADAERALACEALAWLRGLVAGRDSAVYHYSDYEVVRLNRLAAGCTDHPDLAEWARSYAAGAFVDLFALVKRHFFGAKGLGLKVVASAAAQFHWRDEDPGGLNSQRWFADAVHAETADERRAAQQRVLQYNEDDVLATWHLRSWLRTLT